MSITLTPRFITVLGRYFEVNREEIIKDGLQFPDNEDRYIKWFSYGKNLKVRFMSEKNEHHYLCSRHSGDFVDSIITAEQKKCEECEEIHGITFTLCLENKNTDAIMESIKFTKDTSLEEVIEKIEKYSGKVYDFCSCPIGEVVFKDGLCGHCYTYSYTRTEEEGGDCSICYENGGRWGEFMGCNHQFHYSCVMKMDKRICPLCRSNGGFKTDCFDP